MIPISSTVNLPKSDLRECSGLISAKSIISFIRCLEKEVLLSNSYVENYFPMREWTEVATSISFCPHPSRIIQFMNKAVSEGHPPEKASSVDAMPETSEKARTSRLDELSSEYC